MFVKEYYQHFIITNEYAITTPNYKFKIIYLETIS